MIASYQERNEKLRNYFDDKRREYFAEKVCSRNVADIIDNQYKESMMKELIDLTKFPKVSTRGTEISSKLNHFFERKRLRFIWNIKDYIPNQIYFRSR